MLLQRQASGVLTLTLSNSILKDQDGRTGYIASNYQFQFDNPPQAGAIYTAGFSLCGNNSLALGGSAIFYECLSGTFYNLYDRKWAPHCFPIYLVALIGTSAPPVTQSSEGQPIATTVVQSVTEASEGQPRATTAVVTQISDGQPQATTAVPVTQISDGQPQGATGAPVSQLSDGQPQVPTATPVSQISDGQPQAPTGKVSQISDGQPQAPTGTAVTQISDGQPQAPTGKPVSQISDGQPQAPTSTAHPVTQISDGQAQAATSTAVLATSAVAPATFTGGAVPQHRLSSGGLVAMVAGAIALL